MELQRRYFIEGDIQTDHFLYIIVLYCFKRMNDLIVFYCVDLGNTKMK